MKRLLVAVLVSIASLSTSFAQTEESDGSFELRSLSDIITVEHEKQLVNGDSVYVVRQDENGDVVITFKFIDDAKPEGFKYFGYKVSADATVSSLPVSVKGEVDDWKFAPLKSVTTSTNNLRNKTLIYIDGEEKDTKDLTNIQTENGTTVCTYEVSKTLRYTLGKGFIHRLLPGTTVTIVLPSLCVFKQNPDDSSATKPVFDCVCDSASFTFYRPKTDGAILISESIKTSEIANHDEANSYYIQSPAVLTVDNQFTCENVYVESAYDDQPGHAAGIVVAAEGCGRPHIIADSIYFKKNDLDERSLGFFINRSAFSSQFGAVLYKTAPSLSKSSLSKYAAAYGVSGSNDSWVSDVWRIPLRSFAAPVVRKDEQGNNLLTGWIDMYTRQPDEDYVYTTAIITPLYKPDGYIYSKLKSQRCFKWEDYNITPQGQPAYLVHKLKYDRSIRFSGKLRDDEKVNYSLIDASLTNNADEGKQRVFVDNSFPAPLDWRALAEKHNELNGDESFAECIKDVSFSNMHPSIFTFYNIKTGITTADFQNKMYYGYLQPNLANSSLVHCDLSKMSSVDIYKDCTKSYQEADEEYSKVEDLTNGLPYIRFYVDEPIDSISHGKGNRSVVALYFVSQEKYDELHSAENEYYNSDYDVNTLWETQAGYNFSCNLRGTGYFFPYVGAYGPKEEYGDNASVIKMYALPESSEQYESLTTTLKNAIRISVETLKKSGDVEFGVLDDNLGDTIGVAVGGLYRNYPKISDVMSTKISCASDGGFDESDGEHKSFEEGALYMPKFTCKQISLDLKIAKKIKVPGTPIDEVDDGVKAALAVGGVGSIRMVRMPDGAAAVVYDLAGRMVTRLTQAKVSATGLPAGVYFVETTADGVVCKDKVTVK